MPLLSACIIYYGICITLPESAGFVSYIQHNTSIFVQNNNGLGVAFLVYKSYNYTCSKGALKGESEYEKL